MPTYDIAHITDQGLDLIIVPLHANFQFRTLEEQKRAVAELQRAAGKAGWNSTVVPIWDSGGGRMGFLAPSHYHAFLRAIDLGFVAKKINETLNW